MKEESEADMNRRVVMALLVALAIAYVVADRDRCKAALDNIQKLLDIIRGMKPVLMVVVAVGLLKRHPRSSG